MKNRNKEKNRKLPDSFTGWVLLFYGILALSGGLMGVIGLDTFSLTSVSAINNGILHFIGVYRKWPLFPYYAIISRIFMGAGLLWLAGSETEPTRFTGGAVFEFAGVLILVIALLLDNRKSSNPRI